MKFMQIFLILMFFKTAYVHTNGVQIDDSSKDKASCEKDWDQFGAYCYKFEGGPSGTSLSWRGASARCSELGGHLASIHSKEENDFLLNTYAIKNGLYIWIGLHAPGDISKYQWDDGSQIDFKNWAINEPNPIKEEQNLYCALLIDDGLFGEPGEWVDWICEHFEPYICKKKIQTQKVSKGLIPIAVPYDSGYDTSGKNTPENQGDITSTSDTFQTENVSERKHLNTILVDHEFATPTMKTTTPRKDQEESTRSSDRMEIKTPENQGEIISTSNTCRNLNTAIVSAFLIMLLLFTFFR